MGRPRVIKLSDGEISLNGFSKERAAELTKLLTGEAPKAENALEIVTGESFPAPSQPIEGIELNSTAVGYSFNTAKKMFELAVIKYDPATRVCLIEEIKDIGEYKAFAINNFKLEVVKRGLIT